MKYKAVIFDWYGTLVKNVPTQWYRNKLTEIATILCIDPGIFVELWFDRADERMNGVIKNFQEDMKAICQKVGVPVDDEKTNLVTQIRYDMIQNHLVPRDDAIDVLSGLRAKGYMTGLISDCSNEATVVWKSTPFSTLFDVVVFSYLVGFSKPEPRIYQYALDQLKLEPHNCLYIGDGGSHELTGAREVGMYPVLLKIPDEDGTDLYRYNSEEWDGPVISSLTGILALLK